MCAEYLICVDFEALREKYGIRRSDARVDAWAARVLPQTRAPVVLEKAGSRVAEEMRFSLLPSWSKESRVKFATHNARLDGLETKATWKGPFLRRRCLVPISCFIESAYQGAWAGNRVGFESADQPEILSAAGLWDEWRDPSTGEVIRSFALITDEPLPEVTETGHDRSPIFLADEAVSDWLCEGTRTSAELKAVLARRAIRPLQARRDRPLKAGWEKRAGAGAVPADSVQAADAQHSPNESLGI